MATTVIAREVLNETIDEFSTFTFSFVLVVPDGVGSERPPLMSEITDLTISVFLESAPDDPIFEQRRDLRDPDPETRGHYDDATGRLTIKLHMRDNPFLSDAPLNARELHVARVLVRYNSTVEHPNGADGFSKEIVFAVRNLNLLLAMMREGVA